MTARTPTDPDLLLAAARLADLSVTPERLAQLVPVMDEFYGLLAMLHSGDFGETPPAFGFSAQWRA